MELCSLIMKMHASKMCILIYDPEYILLCRNQHVCVQRWKVSKGCKVYVNPRQFHWRIILMRAGISWLTLRPLRMWENFRGKVVPQGYPQHSIFVLMPLHSWWPMCRLEIHNHCFIYGLVTCTQLNETCFSWTEKSCESNAVVLYPESVTIFILKSQKGLSTPNSRSFQTWI